MVLPEVIVLPDVTWCSYTLHGALNHVGQQAPRSGRHRLNDASGFPEGNMHTYDQVFGGELSDISKTENVGE